MGDIWSFFVMFRPDFVDRMIPNGLDDTRRTQDDFVTFCRKNS